MPQRPQGPDPEEQLETYEKEIHELQTQVKFLEVEVILSEALNVAEVLDHDVTGEVVTIKELLGPDRAVVVGRGDEEAVALLAVGLRGQVRAGDPLLFDPRSSYALEKLPKEQVEEAILEDIPE